MIASPEGLIPLKRRCFTLLEMVIVVMVLGVLLGISILQLDSILPDARLKKQVRLTISMIELASNQAVVDGVPLELSFDRSLRKISLDIHESVEDDDEYIEDEEETGPIYEEFWPAELELVQLEVEDIDGEMVEAERIIFLPEGSCDGAVMTWKEESGLKQSMELWPLLGKVSVSELDDSRSGERHAFQGAFSDKNSSPTLLVHASRDIRGHRHLRCVCYGFDGSAQQRHRE